MHEERDEMITIGSKKNENKVATKITNNQPIN